MVAGHFPRSQAEEGAVLEAGVFFGTNIRTAMQPGLHLYETDYPPGLRVPRHGHKPAYFCFLVSGSYWEQYGRRRVTYGPGSVVYHPAGEIHHGDIGDTGGRCFHVAIAARWLDRLSVATLPSEALDCHTGELAWLAQRTHREFVAGDESSSIVTEGLVLEMLGWLVRERRSRFEHVPVILNAVDSRLREEFDHPLTVEVIARDLGVSPIRLARAFRRRFGATVGERLRRIRVERACRQLADPGVPIAAVALATGFSDQSHLTRVFKKMTGMTPAVYRRSVCHEAE